MKNTDTALKAAGKAVRLQSFAPLLLLMPLFFLLFSCSVKQDIELNPNLSGEWTLSGNAPPFAGEAMEDLAILGGYDTAEALYARILSQTWLSLENRPDIRSHSFELSGEHSWNGRIVFDNLKTLLGDGEKDGIVALSTAEGVSTLHFHLDRSTAARIEQLVPMLSDPALSLFNPALTDGISEEDYIQDILAFTFGEENLKDIRAAQVVLRITVPGTISSVEGGQKLSENKVRFAIPFSRLMVPEKPVDWKVRWTHGQKTE